MAGGIPHGFILKHIVFTGFRWGGVLLFAASGGIVFAVDKRKGNSILSAKKIIK